MRVRLAEYPLLLAVIAGFGLWILLQVLHRALWVIVLVLLAIILASALMPAVRLVRAVALPPGGWRIPRPIAVALIYVAIALLLGLGVFFMGRTLIGEAGSFLEDLPSIAEGLVERVNALERGLGMDGLLPSGSEVASQVQGVTGGAGEAVRTGGALAEGAAWAVFQIFLVLMLTLFLIVEAERILGFWVQLFPPSQRGKVRSLSARIGDKIGYWLLGQIAVAAITGTLAGIAAFIWGLPYPIVIGVITAILDLAPVLGPTLMVIPALLLGLLQSPLIALGAGATFLAIAEIEGNVLVPLITGRAVRLSPVMVLVAVPFGLAIYGPLGALMSIPAAVTLQVLTREVLLPWLHERQEVVEEGGRPEAEEDEQRAA